MTKPMLALCIIPSPRRRVLPADVSLVGSLVTPAARPPLDHALEVLASNLAARPSRVDDGKVNGAARALGAVGHVVACRAVDVASLALVAAGETSVFAGAHCIPSRCVAFSGSVVLVFCQKMTWVGFPCQSHKLVIYLFCVCYSVTQIAYKLAKHALYLVPWFNPPVVLCSSQCPSLHHAPCTLPQLFPAATQTPLHPKS